jgi:hypothetical protein
MIGCRSKRASELPDFEGRSLFAESRRSSVSAFASTAFRPTFVTTAIRPLCRGGMSGRINSDYQKLQEGKLRQSGAAGKLHKIDVREMPVVQSQTSPRPTI